MTSSPTFTPRLFPPRLPRVCVAVIGSDANEMADKAESLVRDNPFIEFRLDQGVSASPPLGEHIPLVWFPPRGGRPPSSCRFVYGRAGTHQPDLGSARRQRLHFRLSRSGQETAPGQVTAQQLRTVYRIEQ